MSQAIWVPVLNETALREDTVNLAFPKGLSIILVRKSGKIYALSNKCAHMSCTLAGGQLEGYLLRCPCHEWKFDIRTGEFVDSREISIPTYECKSEGEKIWVNLGG